MTMKRKRSIICSWKPKLWLLPLAFRLPNYNIYIYICIYNINDRTFEINFDENKIDKTYIFYHVKIKNKNRIYIYIYIIVYTVYNEITK